MLNIAIQEHSNKYNNVNNGGIFYHYASQTPGGLSTALAFPYTRAPT